MGAHFAVETVSIHAEVGRGVAEADEAWREGEWFRHGDTNSLGARRLPLPRHSVLQVV
jgi:hypothetical protein